VGGGGGAGVLCCAVLVGRSGALAALHLHAGVAAELCASLLTRLIRRAGELYGGGNILLKARNLVKGLQGVDNVYTQHSPLLTNTLTALRDGSLSTQTYPYMGSTVSGAGLSEWVGGWGQSGARGGGRRVRFIYTHDALKPRRTLQHLPSSPLTPPPHTHAQIHTHAQDEQMAWAAAYKARPPSEAIVFVVGGSTYEEAKAVAEWNSKQTGSGSGANPAGVGALGGAPAAPMRTILGGSSVLNSDVFLAALGAGAGSSVIDLR